MYTVPSHTVWASPVCESRRVHYYEPAPVCYQRDVYMEEPGEVYVMKTLVPAPRRSPVTAVECLAHCIGGLVYGTACCLAATVELGCSCIGGLCRAAAGARSTRRGGSAVPYQCKSYEVGSYEYDMVVYRRPRQTCLQKLFGC